MKICVLYPLLCLLWLVTKTPEPPHHDIAAIHKSTLVFHGATYTKPYCSDVPVIPRPPLHHGKYFQDSSHGTDKPQYDRSALRFSLLLKGGTESNPGPCRPKFLCVMCSKACKTECIACDECNQWVHRTCIGMSTTEFSRLGRSEEAWSCPSCASINNSTRIYSVSDADDQDAKQSLNYSTHPSMLDNVSEISFPSRCSTSTDQTSESSFNNSGDPILTLSPKPAKQPKPQQKSLRIMSINFQSVQKNGKLLEAIILDTDPDIILGTETWLDSSISSNEILPNDLGYDIQRRDRPKDTQ